MVLFDSQMEYLEKIFKVDKKPGWMNLRAALKCLISKLSAFFYLRARLLYKGFGTGHQR